jgi:Tol biopolymer transport system component
MKVLVGVLLAFMGVSLGSQNGTGALQRAENSERLVDLPPTTEPVSLALSPDGDRLVFVAEFEGRYHLWLHALASGETRPLPGTDDILTPFPCWSPDGHSIAYTSNLDLKVLDLETGNTRILTRAPSGRGCSWGRDGTILFAIATARPIFRISQNGGAAQPATSPANPVFFQSPHYLPDGRHFLSYGGGSVYVAETGGDPQKLLPADTAAVYSKSGHLLFVRENTLYGQRFDAGELRLVGNAFVVARQVPRNSFFGAVSISSNGTLAYRTGLGGNVRVFKWFDRSGKEIESIGDPQPVGGSAPAVSPNGHFLAFNGTQNGNADIWLLELASGKLIRFTSNPATETNPVWSRDSNTVFFASNRTLRRELYEKPVTLATDQADDSTEKLVMPMSAIRDPQDVSADGRFILYRGPNTIAAAQLDGNPRGDVSVLDVPADWAQFSPDGRWVAYQSDTSGRLEIHLQPFPSGRSFRVSTNGGAHVRWNPNGKELFYIGPDGKLMAVAANFSSEGQNVELGTPVPLFTPPIIKNLESGPYGQQYVALDGNRFLIASIPEVKTPLKVIRNWVPKE